MQASHVTLVTSPERCGRWHVAPIHKYCNANPAKWVNCEASIEPLPSLWPTLVRKVPSCEELRGVHVTLLSRVTLSSLMTRHDFGCGDTNLGVA